MPETGIGLFPDVGGGWYLSRLPGRIGQFLALTGARIDGAECLALGLATHYLPPTARTRPKQRIAAEPTAIGGMSSADLVEPPPGDARILSHQRDRPPVRLRQAGGHLRRARSRRYRLRRAKELATLRTKSPQTMKVALSCSRTARACRISPTRCARNMPSDRACVQRHDFLEGVRAVIVDKDNAPKWDPATPEGVTDHVIDQIFAPLPEDEAWTPA